MVILPSPGMDRRIATSCCSQICPALFSDGLDCGTKLVEPMLGLLDLLIDQPQACPSVRCARSRLPPCRGYRQRRLAQDA